MAEYVFPAVFTKEDCGYSIYFPDIKNCFTSAETIEEGLKMANDVLCLMLYEMEKNNKQIPHASSVFDIKTNDNEFVNLVSCDTMYYRKFFDSKAVKKTLTIPKWLNELAEKNKINFSLTLQNALKEQLGVE